MQLSSKIDVFWTGDEAGLKAQLETPENGLSDAEALRRLSQLPRKKSIPPALQRLLLFLSQFKSPLTLLLVFGLMVSGFLGEPENAIIILAMLLLSGTLGFIQENRANQAAEKLRNMLQTHCWVLRKGKKTEVIPGQVMRGDIVLLEAGNIIPADCRILQSKDLYVNEAALTGESFPAEKKEGSLPEDTPLARRRNCLFKGTHVVSGTAEALCVNPGLYSELGKIETEMEESGGDTAFEKGIRRFGYMLMRIALILSGVILIFNLILHRPVLDSILFAFALSIGLAPELLPAIVTVTLSAGARKLSEKKVIVRKLASIQNLGAMTVLCSDKTGTITEGEVVIKGFLNTAGKEDEEIRRWTYLNSLYESGFPNPVDEAVRKSGISDISSYRKADEVPYDFIRKRLSVVVEYQDKHLMITKGALKNILEVCDYIRTADGSTVRLDAQRADIEKAYQQFSLEGNRTIGLAIRDVTGDPVITKEDECQMTFAGFILLNDPPKEGITETIARLREKNVGLKIITGDNAHIAATVAERIGIQNARLLSGAEIRLMSEEALIQKVKETDIFPETDPSQKERIVRALQKGGAVVGYLGDGINDAPALNTADVGISVNNAVDVAKEAADLILLEKNLDVLSEGILEGRKTFLNTLKYIFITISANFGNMISMAGASLLVPFLPLLPAQILITNFLTDIPALALAGDKVEQELLLKPRKWDMKLIRNIMIAFGIESSVFDFITFGVLLYVFHAGESMFRTGWFIESVVTEILILLVIRSPRSFLMNMPGKALFFSAIGVILTVVLIPWLPFAADIGLCPLPASVLAVMFVIAILYALGGEITKRFIFKRLNY